MRRIKIYAGLVCPRRSLDCKKLEKYFNVNKCVVCKNPDIATDIIIITCGFIERNIIESLKMINSLKEKAGRLIVCGCLIDIDAQRLSEHYKGLVFSTKNIEEIDNFFPEFKIPIDKITDANEMHDYNEIDEIIGSRENYIEKYFYDRYEFEFKQLPFVIRIGYGCNSKCSYCSHRNAIGRYRDKDWKTCINEFKTGKRKGYSVFKVTSMDTGRYGLVNKQNLPKLLNKFIKIKKNCKFIIEDINPMWLIKYADDIKELCIKRKIKAIQTPIQSGSKSILKKMRRTYDLGKLLKVLKSFKQVNPELHIATEIIIGFPTETEEDFESTLLLIDQAKIDFSYIYPYYENENILSHYIYPKCSDEIIKNRLYNIKNFFEEKKISYCIFAK